MHPKLNKSTNNKKSSALSSIDVLSFNDLRENLPFTLELYKCTSTQTKKKKKIPIQVLHIIRGCEHPTL